MSITIEVSLRIPNVTVREPHLPAKTIVNSECRFAQRVQVPTVPKVGETLQLSTSSGYTFDAIVKRADWHEQKELFVVGCQYSKRSMSPEEFHSLAHDPTWAMRQLLE